MKARRKISRKLNNPILHLRYEGRLVLDNPQNDLESDSGMEIKEGEMWWLWTVMLVHYNYYHIFPVNPDVIFYVVICTLVYRMHACLVFVQLSHLSVSVLRYQWRHGKAATSVHGNLALRQDSYVILLCYIILWTSQSCICRLNYFVSVCYMDIGSWNTKHR